MNDTNESLLSFKRDLYKELYELEVARKKEQSEKLQYVITIDAALFGAYIFLFFEYMARVNDRTVKIADIIIMCLIVVVTFVIIYYISKALLFYDVQKISPTNIVELANAHSNPIYTDEYSNFEIMENINELVMESYSESAISMEQKTDDRLKYVHNAYLWTIIGVVLGIIALYVFYL